MALAPEMVIKATTDSSRYAVAERPDRLLLFLSLSSLSHITPFLQVPGDGMVPRNQHCR
jgi:hypothetical protein